MSDFMNYSATTLSFEDLNALYYKATHDATFKLRNNLTKVKEFFDRNQVELAGILGCIIGATAQNVVTTKWNFDKHSDVVNFVFTMGTNREQADKYRKFITIMKIVSIGAKVGSIIDNEMNKNKGEIA
jgi:hypothetical protein